MDIVNHDYNRENRTGIPEVVLAEPKSNKDLILAITRALEQVNSVLVTRIQEYQLEAINEEIANKGWKGDFDDFNRTLILSKKEIEIKELGVAIFSAGTSDRYIVEEIRLTMKFLGWNTTIRMDVGVAGLHRFREALDSIESDKSIKCLILVAGQDGALFPVVTGQTRLPVIAVPTSIGYGFGGKGETALRSALQSCAPGISVVNIDNGFGAATMAAKILNLF